MNHLLEITNFAEKLAPLDALTYGGGVVLLGMGTVFAVLIIIWVVLACFKFFFHDLKFIGKNKKAPVVEATPEVVASPAASDEEEIIAVIAAAIAMAESESANGTKFRVVSFNRK